MKQYVVVPRKNEDYIEKYEEGYTNVIEFKALDYQGNYIHNMAELQITFGANAVEGLGNELLRSHISGEKIMGLHLQRSNDENYIYEGMGICISPKSPDIVFTEIDLDIKDLIRVNLESQTKLKELFNITKITEDDKCELKAFITNQRIVYGRLELSAYTVIKLSINKCKILNKIIDDHDGFEISTVELISKI